jgi:hypothetical protein
MAILQVYIQEIKKLMIFYCSKIYAQDFKIVCIVLFLISKDYLISTNYVHLHKIIFLPEHYLVMLTLA